MPEIPCGHPDCPTPKIHVFDFIPKTTVVNSTKIEVGGGIVIKGFNLPKSKLPKDVKIDVPVDTTPNDYLVLYCNSNHKNIYPIYTPPQPKTNQHGKEEKQK